MSAILSIDQSATTLPHRLDVRVTGGIVRGVQEDGVLAWRGIPYAAPPSGENRFRAPRPVVAWAGVRDAAQYGLIAPQAYKGQFKGADPRIPSGEDCLTLNVLRPTAATRKRLGRPVIVFIHGGGYSVGSSQDFPGRGERFVQSGRVIYVSFNYRLGALGYLDFSRYSTAEHPLESNLGLRDQLAALRWVRDNIRSFGGNPRNVTLIGESAGGNAVVTLMATPAAAGLFARAIAQSPPTNTSFSRALTDGWAAELVDELRLLSDRRAPSSTGADIVDATGTTGTTGTTGSTAVTAPTGGDQAPTKVMGVNELLRTATVADLTRAAVTVQARTPDANPGTFCLVPVVDGDLLPERPLDAFRNGRAHRVPLIIGTNEREGSLFRGRVDILPRSPARIAAVYDSAPLPARDAMRAVYSRLPANRAAIDFGGDFVFWYPSVQIGELHSRRAEVYVYRFDLAPRLMHLLGIGATHGLELFALFDQVDGPVARAMTVLGGREPFINAGERMRRHWLRFACTGRPDRGWPTYTESERLTLIIDEADRVESDPRADRRSAWQDFLPDF